jgi:DNA replication protein DnaC
VVEIVAVNDSVRHSAVEVPETCFMQRPEQSNAFFKLMEERYVGKRTTLITTNLAYEAWYEFLGNKKMVEALLDRLRERCHTITIEGPSLRTPSAPVAS